MSGSAAASGAFVTRVKDAAEQARQRARSGGSELVAFTVECDVDVERLVSSRAPSLLAPRPRGRTTGRSVNEAFEYAFVWDARGSETLDAELAVGLGAARCLPPGSSSTSADVARLFAGIGGETAKLRAFGGLAFDGVELGDFEPLRRFRFAIPRWTFVASPVRASRVLVVARVDGSDDAVLDLEARSIEACHRGSAPDARDSASSSRIVDDGGEVFVRLVEQANDAIDAALFEKVVVARTVEISGAPSVRAVLGRLRGAAGCVRFGLATNDGAFVGATPEVLVACDERGIRTEAVAGSEPRKGADLAEVGRLLVREKDRREHTFVVDAIRAGLERVGAEVQPIEEPRVRSLTHVHHLVTSIQATKPRASVLDLALGLHPTPAMCGAPREAAAAFLRAREGRARGFYASPIGWVDARGNGAFVVGIRSSLMLPSRAFAFAGAGIVRGSIPGLELEETGAKLRSVLDALGATDKRPRRTTGGPLRKEAGA